MTVGKAKLDRLRRKLAEREVYSTRRRHEYFRIKEFHRTYDRRRNKFLINIAYETSAPVSPRSIAVAEAFGLGLDKEETFVIYDNVELTIGHKDIVLITGDSGSGKSVLLRALREDLGSEAVDVTELRFDIDKPLIESVGKSVEEGLELLAKVGLGDAFLFLRTYSQLSDGQKYRYRIAKMVETKARFWIFDEFVATLDRDTAKIVSYNLQKIARAEGKCVIAATTHMDLFEDYSPSVHIHKRFGQEIIVNYDPKVQTRECSLIKEMHIEEGTVSDWEQLARFHYRSHKIAPPRKIFCLKRRSEVCGVIVYSYPAPACYGRRLVLPKMSVKDLNEELCTLSRVVMHPKYRTIGLGAKLVKETLPLAGTPNVEMLAVMAKYNPFAEKAGMQKITEQPPAREAVNITSLLTTLGFDPQLLSCRSHVLSQLQSLSDEKLQEIRQAFIKHRSVRFLKTFFYRLPFGRTNEYKKRVAEANIDKLASLIRICGFLMQSKAYLYWTRTQSRETNQNPIGGEQRVSEQ